jgi:hypothetical protein
LRQYFLTALRLAEAAGFSGFSRDGFMVDEAGGFSLLLLFGQQTKVTSVNQNVISVLLSLSRKSGQQPHQT